MVLFEVMLVNVVFRFREIISAKNFRERNSTVNVSKDKDRVSDFDEDEEPVSFSFEIYSFKISKSSYQFRN